MVYVLSLVVYLLILAAGIYIIKKSPKRVERYAAKIALIGFFVQMFINWASLGNLPFMPQIDILAKGQHGSLDFMLLSLVSIFCYAALLVIFYKAYDYYQNEKGDSSPSP